MSNKMLPADKKFEKKTIHWKAQYKIEFHYIIAGIHFYTNNHHAHNSVQDRQCYKILIDINEKNSRITLFNSNMKISLKTSNAPKYILSGSNTHFTTNINKILRLMYVSMSDNEKTRWYYYKLYIAVIH